MEFIIGLLVVLVLVGIFVAVLYNSLVKLRNRVQESWAQISVQLQRRYDLIPNLVETVKGYAKHESETLTQVTSQRAGLPKDVTNLSVEEAQKLSQQMDREMLAINAVVENYPDLKASQNFLKLQEELTTTENKVSFARQAYNDSVLDFNNKVETFPSNLIAGMFSFKTAEYFDVETPEAKQAPKVSF